MRLAWHLAGWLVLFTTCTSLVAPLHAQDRPRRLSIWDIHLGDEALAIPNEFVSYACGTNGGPPSVPLANFTEFSPMQARGERAARGVFRI